MRNKYLVLLSLVLLIACKADAPSVDNNPASVAKAWQKYLDKNEFEAAIELSAPEAAAFVRFLEEDVRHLNEPDSAMTATVIKEMQCTVAGEKAICKYTDEFGREDQFDLIKINGQWLVDLLINEDLDSDLDDMLEDFEEMIEGELQDSVRQI